MKISVVIPAYNEEDFIGKALKSVTNQKIAPDEIIVVNNNSTDRTEVIAKKLGAKVVSEKKQGMIHARNRGFNESKFDIIARIDADVIVPPDWILKIKNDFENNSIDALTGPAAYYDSILSTMGDLPSKIYLEALRLGSKGKRYLMGMNMSLTRDMWVKVHDKVNLDDSKVHEDVDLSINIVQQGGVIKYDPHLTVRASGRRIKNHPESFFIEYPVRMVKTFIENKR